jgi:DNA-binding PadR family transcriptional regulator
MQDIIPIHHKIYQLRGRQIMLDEDLAELYGVETKVFNQAVKRNIDRFPEDFMFKLTESEYENLRSQFVTSSLEKHGGRRYHPYAFTEQGVYMLSAVLKSSVAVQVSIEIMRTFAKLREFTLHYNALAKKLIEMDRKNDKDFRRIHAILDELMDDTRITDEKVMGFLRQQGDQ